MKEALSDFRQRAVTKGVFTDEEYQALSTRWERMIFHLPYAFHAKRMYVETFIEERKAAGTWAEDQETYGFAEPIQGDFPDSTAFQKAWAGYLKSVSTSDLYRNFIAEKLEKGQRASSQTGNLYTASIFLALMSTLEADLTEGNNLAGARLGFVAYGSGSKAKVFEGYVQDQWKEVVEQFNLFTTLEQRQPINYAQYEALHKGLQKTPLYKEGGRYGLSRIGTEGATLGARYYAMQKG